MKIGKVVLIGCGLVGCSALYSMINIGVGTEYVLIDIFKESTIGNAMDLEDAAVLAQNSSVKVSSGAYSDCGDAELIIITAGRPQKEGETRDDLLRDNGKIMAKIASSIKKTEFSGITLVVSNPCDALASVYLHVTKYNPFKILSSGTLLDSARFRLCLGKYFNCHPTSIQTGYILGEHGDNAFAYISNRSLKNQISKENLKSFKEETINRAYKIIKYKRSTFYGIGASVATIANSIINNRNFLLPVGSYNEEEKVYISHPSIISSNNVKPAKWFIIDISKHSEWKKSIAAIKKNVKIACSDIK